MKPWQELRQKLGMAPIKKVTAPSIYVRYNLNDPVLARTPKPIP